MSSLPQIAHDDEDALDINGVWHSLTCPCEACAKWNADIQKRYTLPPLTPEEEDEQEAATQARKAERLAREDARGAEAWRVFREKLDAQVSRDLAQKDHPEYESLMAAMDDEDGDPDAARAALERYGEIIRDYRDLLYREAHPDEADTLDLASMQHTLPLVAGDGDNVPALLERSDGATLLYEGRLNSIFGEPGLGKSWMGAMTAIQAIGRGSRVIWWDHEDVPSTLATRLTALGAGELVESKEIIFATPSLAEDRVEMAVMCQWMKRGRRPGLVVIDSVESAGLPTDSNNAAQWYEKRTDPFVHNGTSLLNLDHVPKRRDERPRGPIGSTHKNARLTGAALFLDGKPWTKREGGRVKLVNHKDKHGDLPAGLLKTVAIVEVTHSEDGKLIWAIRPPDAEDVAAEDVTLPLLEAIASHGKQGVRTWKAVRGLLKAGHRVIDPALEDLMKMGFMAKGQDGNASVFVVTPEGEIYLAEASG